MWEKTGGPPFHVLPLMKQRLRIVPLHYVNAEVLVLPLRVPDPSRFEGSGFRSGLAQTFRGKSATLACASSVFLGANGQLKVGIRPTSIWRIIQCELEARGLRLLAVGEA